MSVSPETTEVGSGHLSAECDGACDCREPPARALPRPAVPRRGCGRSRSWFVLDVVSCDLLEVLPKIQLKKKKVSGAEEVSTKKVAKMCMQLFWGFQKTSSSEAII